MKFHIRESKHDFLYKVVAPLAQGLIRKAVGKAIEQAIKTGLEYVDEQLVGVKRAMNEAKESDGASIPHCFPSEPLLTPSSNPLPQTPPELRSSRTSSTRRRPRPRRTARRQSRRPTSEDLSSPSSPPRRALSSPRSTLLTRPPRPPSPRRRLRSRATAGSRLPLTSLPKPVFQSTLHL